MRLARLLVINLAVLVGLLIAINAISAVALELIPTTSVKPDPRADLPNYRNKRQARAIFSDWQRSRQIGFVPFLDWTWRRTAYEGRTTTVDSLGERVTPRPLHASNGRRKTVRFFGGSAMWGVGSDDQGTIPAIYQRLHPDVMVFNHGEPDYNTRQNLERLINLLNQGQRVDEVVFYEGFNDVGSLCRTDVNINGQDQEARMRFLLDRAQSANRPALGGTDNGSADAFGLSLGAAIKTLLYARTQQLLGTLTMSPAQEGEFGNGERRCATDAKKAKAVAETVVKNLSIAHTLVHAAGGRFIAILQPVAYIGSPQLGDIDKKKKRGGDTKAVYALWRADARRLSWLYDFTSVFNGEQNIYIDPVHVTSSGNEIVARKVAAILDHTSHKGL